MHTFNSSYGDLFLHWRDPILVSQPHAQTFTRPHSFLRWLFHCCACLCCGCLSLSSRFWVKPEQPCCSSLTWVARFSREGTWPDSLRNRRVDWPSNGAVALSDARNDDDDELAVDDSRLAAASSSDTRSTARNSSLLTRSSLLAAMISLVSRFSPSAFLRKMRSRNGSLSIINVN